MKPVTSWDFHPYNPPLRDFGGIYVCRLAPSKNAVHVEWLDADEKEYTVSYAKRGSAEGQSLTVYGTECDITALDENEDYEITVRAGEKYSRTRLAHTADAVGDTVVNYLHPEDDAYAFSGRYLCSPTIVRHPDGFLLAGMDVFKANAPQNLELIFRSDDDGESWHYVSELYPCFWGRLFIYENSLYMLSCSTEYGDLLIGRSDDGGKTFTVPTVLLRGGCKCNVAGVHKNPQPPVIFDGRMWFTMEWGAWAIGTHAAMVGSFPVGADPLDAANWLFSEPCPYDPSWKGVAEGPSAGNIEGTLVVFPDGGLYNVMRYDMGRAKPRFGRVLAYRVNTKEPESPLVYDHAIELPGNHSKFMIRYDEVSGCYYTVICRITDPGKVSDRRLLSLMKSKDCEKWELACDLMDFRDKAEAEAVGFQYPDFFIEGEDIFLLCRTAMNGAANFHDANYSTFHRIRNFRLL
jgi:hypothetical protein